MSYQSLILADDPAVYLALDEATGLLDFAGGHLGLGWGGVTIGTAVTSPLEGGSFSTNLDGSNDRIMTTYTTYRNWAKDPEWVGSLGTLTNDGGTCARSTTQVRRSGGGALKATKTGGAGTNNAYDSDLTRWQGWPFSPSTPFCFSAYVYPATTRTYQARVDVYRYSDDSFQFTATGEATSCPANQWTRVSVVGRASSSFACDLRPMIQSENADVPAGDIFYTTEWLLAVGSDGDGWQVASANGSPPLFNPAPDDYQAFGSLVQMGEHSQGPLLISYRVGEDHFGAGDYGDVLYRISRDQGVTWTNPRTIAAEAGVDNRNTGAGVSSTGRVFVFYSRVDPDEGPPGNGLNLSLNYKYSDDHGDTWSAAQTLPDTGAGNDLFGIYGNLIQIDEGKLMVSFWALDAADSPGQVCVVFSDDDGVTWSSPTVAGYEVDKVLSETSFVHLGGGTIVGIARDDAGTTFTQLLSTNNGASWTNQGLTTFDSWSNPSPATLVTFDNATRVACYWVNRTERKLRVVYADAAELVNGPSAWDASPTELRDTILQDSGYVGAVHPFDDERGYGWYYDNAGEIYFFNSIADTAPLREAPFFDGSGYRTEGDTWIDDPGGHVGWYGTANDSLSERGCFANGTTRSFEFWVDRDADATNDTILSSDQVSGPAHPYIRLNSGGDNIEFNADNLAGGPTTFSGAGAAVGEWGHGVLIFNEAADQLSLYVGGSFFDTEADPTHWPVSSYANLQFGMAGTVTDPADAKFGHCAVYERALTPSEIQSHYQAATEASTVGSPDASPLTFLHGAGRGQ